MRISSSLLARQPTELLRFGNAERDSTISLPWTVIRVEDVEAYLAAPDRASIDIDSVSQRVRWSLEQRKHAS